MAERVSRHRFARGRKAGYAWEEWLDGGTWRLVPGEDFAVSPESFRRIVHQNAVKRGGQARTSIENGSFFLQFVREGGE